MKLFPSGHATHPQWRMAAGLVLAQLRAQMALPDYASSPTLGLLYITDHYASEAQEILDHLSAELPEVTDWSGTVGIGVSANNAEYFDEPGMSLMLCALPSDQYRVFSGVAPLGNSEMSGFEAHTALVHADPATPDLSELIAEMAGRTDTGYLFGGLSSGRGGALQFAIGGNGNIRGHGAARGVDSRGLSGVVSGEGERLVARDTQGSQPLRSGAVREREITEADGNLLLKLDGEPALDVLLADLQVSLERPQEAIDAVRNTLVGLADAGSDGIRRTGDLGADVLVRHIIGLDPTRRGIAIADTAEAGMRLTFCRRNAQAARAALLRSGARPTTRAPPSTAGRGRARALGGPAGGGGGGRPPPPPRRIRRGALRGRCT
jgi:small ligand-binding sensory domain FIST